MLRYSRVQIVDLRVVSLFSEIGLISAFRTNVLLEKYHSISINDRLNGFQKYF